MTMSSKEVDDARRHGYNILNVKAGQRINLSPLVVPPSRRARCTRGRLVGGARQGKRKEHVGRKKPGTRLRFIQTDPSRGYVAGREKIRVRILFIWETSA
jgi:hypothetical protein